MPPYESEHTIFMRTMLEQHPEWREDQKAGRALLWDRRVDQVEQAVLRSARVAQRPYPYDVNFPEQLLQP
jgi:Protein of unknown function (DUF3460)